MAPGQHEQRVPVSSLRGCAVRAIPGTGRARASRWECCSAEPTSQVTDQHGTGPALPTSQMHASGVGSCPTCRPGRAGNPLVGRWSRCRWDRRGGRYTSRGAAAPQGDGRGTPRPCTGWTSIPSRAHARRGSAVRCLPCRGRALPDPPARRAGNGRAAWPDVHSAERPGREDDCCLGRRAGGVVRRRSASPWHRLRGPSPVARYLPRFGAADSLCRAQALPDPPAREGWA